MPGAVALAGFGADDGPECGRTSRHSDDEPPAPGCAEGPDGAVGPDGADGVTGAGGLAVSRDDDVVGVAAADVAVKDGRRSLGEVTGEPAEPEPEPEPEPEFAGGGGGGAMSEPGVATAGGREAGRLAASGSSSESFADGLNQLLVAAIACLTAWRPLSNTPLGPVPVPVPPE